MTGGFEGGHGLIAHFGLGDASQVAKLRIEWPSGIFQEPSDVTADQILTVRPREGRDYDKPLCPWREMWDAVGEEAELV